MPTKISNQIPASAHGIAVELTTGEKIGDDRAVRWLDVKTGKYVYQVQLGDDQYLGFRTKGGKIRLL